MLKTLTSDFPPNGDLNRNNIFWLGLHRLRRHTSFY